MIQYGKNSLHYPDKVYLFGDVHNEADKLMDVLDQIEPLITPEDHIVFLGDLFDRGKEAALTLETLVNIAKKYPTQVFFVEGNHDVMVREYITKGSLMWMQYVGSTINDFMEKWGLPDQYPETIAAAMLARGFKEITSRTIPYYETPDIIGTHAPLDPTIVLMNGGNSYQDDYKNRADVIGFTYLLDRMKYEIKWQFTDEQGKIPWVDKFHVCGHQAGRGTHPRIFKDRAFIDTACGLRPNGVLTCLVYPGKNTYQSK